jgi:putative transposase
MTQGRRRKLIPPAYSDLSQWPAPDIEISRSDPKFELRRLAVEMYANGDSQETIFELTGKDRGEVRRLIRRCISLAADGQIVGFYALLSGWRTDGYVREAAVIHAVGAGSGGCAGALRQLFDRFPEVEEYIRYLFFKDNSSHSVHEARISYHELHAEFKRKLEELGLTENDWPFNTAGQGYQSLRRYCISLREDNSDRSMAARSGEEAARRGAVGRGEKTILPLLRGFGAVQLDFHLVDAASVT